ncbi:MAG: aspartate/glutamate racemase family protein [Cyanobacteria bacterium P01_E01_bin.42]
MVVDLGLGGLSVMAALTQRLQDIPLCDRARIIFLNLEFDTAINYENSSTQIEIVQQFDRDLVAISSQYQPHLLLIACNTLSVLYRQTQFIHNPLFPVVDIINMGVKTIARHLDKFPQQNVLIFGTSITTNSRLYSQHLESYGSDRIIEQNCPFLAESIERNYASQETEEILESCIVQALNQLESTNKSIAISLNCTHYGYIIDKFRSHFANRGYPNIKILNPNAKMSDFLFSGKNLSRHLKTEVQVEVLSKIPISSSLAKLLEPISRKTVRAFFNYNLSKLT